MTDQLTLKIIHLVAEEYGVSVTDITTKQVRRHKANIVCARQVAAYLLVKHTKATKQSISLLMGYAHKQCIQ